ncbi:hypothetical protein AAMO2058_001479600 [Amorphochlora amoebiformis]
MLRHNRVTKAYHNDHIFCDSSPEMLISFHFGARFSNPQLKKQPLSHPPTLLLKLLCTEKTGNSWAVIRIKAANIGAFEITPDR